LADGRDAAIRPGTSEILGEDTLKIDREQRILGLRAAAKKSLGMRARATVPTLTPYARG